MPLIVFVLFERFPVPLIVFMLFERSPVPLIVFMLLEELLLPLRFAPRCRMCPALMRLLHGMPVRVRRLRAPWHTTQEEAHANQHEPSRVKEPRKQQMRPSRLWHRHIVTYSGAIVASMGAGSPEIARSIPQILHLVYGNRLDQA